MPYSNTCSGVNTSAMFNSVLTFTWTAAKLSRMPEPRSRWYCTRAVSLAMIGGHMARTVYLFRDGEEQLSAFSKPRLAERLRFLCPSKTDTGIRGGSHPRLNGT